MSPFQCVRHPSPATFLERAQAWLLRSEAEHNLILGIAMQLKSTPASDTYFATLEQDGDVVGCAFRTPPQKLGVTRMPAGAAEALFADVTSVYRDVPGVLGPETEARIVADGMARSVGKAAVPGMRNRIYELTEVVPPESLPAGRLRLAGAADTELIANWLEQFKRETHHGPGDMLAYTRTHITRKSLFVWDDDGPKTTAAWGGLTPNGVRVSFVFTPPEQRGRGYASACVGAVSQRALDTGYRFCCLYTDLDNPTSNNIYQKLGYRAVCDVVDYMIV